MLEFQQQLQGGHVSTPFVLGELGLGDSKDLGKLHLTYLEPTDLPDPSGDRSQIRCGAGGFRLT